MRFITNLLLQLHTIYNKLIFRMNYPHSPTVKVCKKCWKSFDVEWRDPQLTSHTKTHWGILGYRKEGEWLTITQIPKYYN